MPSVTWTSQADFQTWSLTNLNATAGGALEVSAGQQSGTGTSPVTQPTGGWANWGLLTITCPHAEGTVVLAQIRSGTTSAECTASGWSDYFGANEDGQILLDVDAWRLNTPAATYGRYIQVKLTLKRE